jgi:glycosyltransferase involved in cell wall biosynthesis
VQVKPDISVIVPHYNDLEGLAACLKALEAQALDDGKSFEIIVADNASPIPEPEILKVIAKRGTLVRIEERGAGPARNGGAKVAQGKVLAFTDSDCLPERSWLNEGLSALAHSDIVGGRMEVIVGRGKRKSGAEAFEQVFAFNNAKYVSKHGFSVTANLFCRAETFSSVGPFRTGVSEDVEWSRRATAKGYNLGYCEHAVVGHPARKNWQELLRKWRRLDEETYALHIHEGKSTIRWLLRACLVAFSAIPHSHKVVTNRKLQGIGERARALVTLVSVRTWRAWHYLWLGLSAKN